MSFIHLTPPAELALFPAPAGISGLCPAGLHLPEPADRRRLRQVLTPLPLPVPGFECWQLQTTSIEGGGLLVSLSPGPGQPPAGLLGIALHQAALPLLLAQLEAGHLRHYAQQVTQDGHQIGEHWLSLPVWRGQLPWLALLLTPAAVASGTQVASLVQLEHFSG